MDIDTINRIRYNEKYSVFQATGEHGLLAVTEYQVRRMANDIRAQHPQGAGGLREDPVKTNHHPDVCPANFMNLQGSVAGVKPVFFLIE
jgi:hypothetical protein